MPLSVIKQLLRLTPALTRLRVAYVKNINTAFVREIGKRLPRIEWLDLNAGGLQKGLGADGEIALLELAGKCRQLKFLRIPSCHFSGAPTSAHAALRQFLQALPRECALTNKCHSGSLRVSHMAPEDPTDKSKQ